MPKKRKKEKRAAGQVIICPEGPKKPGSYGTASHNGKCPKCGGLAVSGFGLAMGGMGPYETCNNGKCDWSWKEVPKDE